MGLALVKRVLELTDGHIIVDSKPQEGTTFTVFKPIAENVMDMQQDRTENEMV